MFWSIFSWDMYTYLERLNVSSNANINSLGDMVSSRLMPLCTGILFIHILVQFNTCWCMTEYWTYKFSVSLINPCVFILWITAQFSVISKVLQNSTNNIQRGILHIAWSVDIRQYVDVQWYTVFDRNRARCLGQTYLICINFGLSEF